MESKKINQLATELTPALSDLTIIGDPTTGISKKITLSQMASLFTGTVEEYPNLASFPLVGVADTIYIALDTNVLYRWDTTLTSYVELSPNIINSLVFNDANGFDGTISLVGSTATLTITTALTTGSVPFIGASGALSQDNANLFFDDTNNRLGVNTNVPTTALDVFGSGIIGRLNGTTTNNAFLGFASAGTNKWSIGNVQSDHRFRIYNEATTSELVSVLQTGEFGIGIANPLTKLHIFGGASALIANLDANTSVAKSISFRSGNSSRINLEVSGTESGSNAGADLFVRAYTDAGALLSTPLTITRSTGNVALTGDVSIAMGSDTSYGKLNIKSNSTTAYAGINVFANTNDRFIALNHNGTLGIIEVNNAGSTIMTPLTLRVGGDERLRISTTGLVGIGTNSPSYILDVKSSTTSNHAILVDNTYTSTAQGTASVFLANAGVLKVRYDYARDLDAGILGTIANIPMLFYSNGTERMRITSGGNVGIGTSSPGALLAVQGASGADGFGFFMGGAGSTLGGIKMGNAGSTYGSLYFDNATNDVLLLQQYTSGSLRFGTNSAERMRITSGGDMYIGNTAISTANTAIFLQKSGIITTVRAYSSGTIPLVEFYKQSAGDIGSISYNGTNTLYNSTSDYRLKEDLKDYNAFEIIGKLKTYNFKWKDKDVRDYGMMAHELQEVLPNYVSGEKDAIKENGTMKIQGVDYSKIVPILVKAIQEQQAQIEELKALINK